MRIERWRSLGIAAITLAVAAVPRPARAQSSPVSVDAALGFAHVGRGSYGNRSRVGERGRLDVRVATLGATEFILGGSAGWYGGYTPRVLTAMLCVNMSGQTIGCGPVPPPSAPNILYVGAHFGVRRPITSLATIEADAGAGLARTSPEASSNRLGVSGDLDLVFGETSHLALVCGVQLLTVSASGARLYVYPVTLGLRLR